MAGFYQKTITWLGLDEQYSETTGGELHPEEARSGAEDLNSDVRIESDRRTVARTESANGIDSDRRNVGPRPGVTSSMASNIDDGPADPLAPVPLAPERQPATTVRAVPLEDSSQSGSRSGTVRAVPLAKTAMPETVVPESFNNAQDVADVYKRSKPVVVDLTGAERDLARRLIDFSAGLCYGLGGQMEKISRDRYLLVPDGVELSAADRRSLED